MTDGLGGDAVRDEALDIVAAGEDLAAARADGVSAKAEVARLGEAVAAAAGELGALDASLVVMRGEREGLDVRIAASAAERDELEAKVDGLRADLGRVEKTLAALLGREVGDERRIAVDLGIIQAGLGDAGFIPPVVEPAPPAPPVPPPPVVAQTIFHFFVDGKPYDTDQARMSGLQIKAKVPDWDPSHDLSLEGVGAAADRIIPDGEFIDFAAATAPLHFGSVPRASFG